MKQIESARTLLRRFNKLDFDNLVELESDPDIMRFTGPGAALPNDRIKERLDKLLKEEDGPLGVWAAELKDSHDFVGWFMLKQSRFDAPELGFMLVKRHWGKGLATEISQSIIDYGFKIMGLQKIVATTHPENAPSIRVLEKLGMQYRKLFANYLYYEMEAPNGPTS